MAKALEENGTAKALEEKGTLSAALAPSSLSIEELAGLRKRQLREQEALCEQQRLSYLAALAAVERLRRECEAL